MCIYIYIYIYFNVELNIAQANGTTTNLHSAKGGAVETGCSGLHYIIGCFAL